MATRPFPAWLLTVAVGLALRIGVVGHEFKLSFAIVATLFLGLFLLGLARPPCRWRRRGDGELGRLSDVAQNSANAST